MAAPHQRLGVQTAASGRSVMLCGPELLAWAVARDADLRKQYSKKDLKNAKGGRISLICPGLLLGNRDGAADTEGLARRGVTALANLGGGQTPAGTRAMLDAAARGRAGGASGGGASGGGASADADAGTGAGADADAATPASLRQHWRTFKGAKHPKVIGFYGHSPGKPLREFSNFYAHAAFEFVLPACCRRDGFPASAPVEFTEKAVMLCKAAVMGDRDSFDAIAATAYPDAAKKLGRGVHPWDQAKWDAVVCRVAESACKQKFAKVSGLAEVLLQTGDKLIAEATRGDRIWGIGLNRTAGEVQFPGQWKGTNILGWALMQARGHLNLRGGSPGAVPSKRAKRHGGEGGGAAAARATHKDGNYLKVQVEDRDGVPLAPHFDTTADFIHSHCGGAAGGGGAVFVHCRGGIHRSPAMVICYLMKHRGLSLADAQAVCALGRPQMRCSPRDAAHHWAELEGYEAALRATPARRGHAGGEAA